MDTPITDEQLEAAAGILRPDGYDVPAETLRRALVAAFYDVHEHRADRCCREHGHHVSPHRGCILR